MVAELEFFLNPLNIFKNSRIKIFSLFQICICLTLGMISVIESVDEKKIQTLRDHMKRLHLDQETGLDGKVRSVRFNSDPATNIEPDDLIPGVRAFGLPKNKLELEPEPDITILFKSRFADEDEEPKLGDPRSKPSIEAYQPKLNGIIERIPLTRATRSIEKSYFNELNDLQADEAKVFRPLFVYRQQVEK